MNSARSFLLQGLAQSDLDMNNHKLLNLDTSNLSISGLPPTVAPPASNWLNSWNRITQVWGYSQPAFTDISGSLTSGQMLAINTLGTVTTGTWQGSVIGNTFLPTLDVIRPPIASVSLNTQKITNLANPANPLDAVNFQTMNTMVPGLQVHAPVAAASTAFISSLSGLILVDGYTPSIGDRILVKNQSDGGAGHLNGVWVAGTGAWVRATDMDTVPEFKTAYVFVSGGSVNASTSFVQITPDPVDITVDDPANPNFVVFNQNSTVTAGPGLQKIGNVISAVGTGSQIVIGSGIGIDNSYSGQASIIKVGAIISGTWQADVISPTYGGTGTNNGTRRLILNAGNLQINAPGFPGLAVSGVLFNTLATPVTLTLPTTGQLATLNGVETFTNKSINASNINSGVLPVSVGGTGAGTAMTALLNLLPSISGQAGKSLKTDGVTVFWG